MKYAWIREHDKKFAVSIMCDVLQISTSGYYGWLEHKPSTQRQRREHIAQAAARFYFESERIYGYRKIYVDLRQANIDCCRETVRRIMNEIGLFSRVKRKFVHTTDSNHDMAVAQNLLDRDFAAAAVNTKWAADITYISTEQGWMYLAAVMDLYSRRIIGWVMSEHIDSDLVISALQMAISQRKPQTGLLHHSDRGSQYASDNFQDLLDDNGIVCSMSRKGDCWDNACMESFFGSLKTEWVRDKRYSSFTEAEKDIFKYVEIFYNRRRRHASLGYLSPAAYEELNGNERKEVA
jgi:transposase InsO family protein